MRGDHVRVCTLQTHTDTDTQIQTNRHPEGDTKSHKRNRDTQTQTQRHRDTDLAMAGVLKIKAVKLASVSIVHCPSPLSARPSDTLSHRHLKPQTP